MLGIYVSVPVACFRKGLAREFLETEALPPPATCYGFLLSLVGVGGVDGELLADPEAPDFFRADLSGLA